MKSCGKETANCLLNCLIDYMKVNTLLAALQNSKRERVVNEDINNTIDAPHLLIQNAKMDEFNERVHNTPTGNKYQIKAQYNVILELTLPN